MIDTAAAARAAINAPGCTCAIKPTAARLLARRRIKRGPAPLPRAARHARTPISE
jgi:hypothetical protein